MKERNSSNHQSSPRAHGNRIPRWLGGVLLLLWLTGSAAAFWFMQWQYLRPYDAAETSLSTQFFEGQFLRPASLQPSTGHTGMLVHFWDPQCPCTRFSTPHIKDLLAEADLRGLSSRVVVRTTGHDSSDAAMKVARKAFGEKVSLRPWSAGLAAELKVPASPSALVIDGAGELMYAGPYSSDAFCSTDKDAFVEQAMQQLFMEQSVPVADNHLAVACFCRWQDRPAS